MSTDPCRSKPSRQGSARPRGRAWLASALMMLLAGGALAQEQATDEPERDAEGNIVFLHALDNQPIEFTWRPDQDSELSVRRVWLDEGGSEVEFELTVHDQAYDEAATVALTEEHATRLCAVFAQLRDLTAS